MSAVAAAAPLLHAAGSQQEVGQVRLHAGVDVSNAPCADARVRPSAMAPVATCGGARGRDVELRAGWEAGKDAAHDRQDSRHTRPAACFGEHFF